MAARFLKLSGVGAELNISYTQEYALVRRNVLSAIKIGGRGHQGWRSCREVTGPGGTAERLVVDAADPQARDER